MADWREMFDVFKTKKGRKKTLRGMQGKSEPFERPKSGSEVSDDEKVMGQPSAKDIVKEANEAKRRILKKKAKKKD